MRPKDLLTWVQATPFEPFRVRLNSGRTFDVPHPEMVRVGRSDFQLFTFAGVPSDPYERVDMISLALIESIEAIPAVRRA